MIFGYMPISSMFNFVLLYYIDPIEEKETRRQWSLLFI